VFHSSLLCIHVPNDDCLFPGCLDEQIPELGGTVCEWIVDKILSHQGSHSDAKFEILWTSGDKMWLPYGEIAHLRALTDYFEVLGINDITRLTDSNIGDVSDDDEDVTTGCIAICICRPDRNCPVHQDISEQHSPPVTMQSALHGSKTSTSRRPHQCPLKQPPVIPFVGTTRRGWQRNPSPGPSRSARRYPPGPSSRRPCQRRPRKTAPNCANND